MKLVEQQPLQVASIKTHCCWQWDWVAEQTYPLMCVQCKYTPCVCLAGLSLRLLLKLDGMPATICRQRNAVEALAVICEPITCLCMV